MRFLICTDVAARGLDISGLPYVVNVTLPDRAEDYIHRVGRVGGFLLCFACSPVLSLNEPAGVWHSNCTQNYQKPHKGPSNGGRCRG